MVREEPCDGRETIGSRATGSRCGEPIQLGGDGLPMTRHIPRRLDQGGRPVELPIDQGDQAHRADQRVTVQCVCGATQLAISDRETVKELPRLVGCDREAIGLHQIECLQDVRLCAQEVPGQTQCP